MSSDTEGTPRLADGSLAPFMRAVIRNGELFLNEWHPGLVYMPTERAMYLKALEAGNKLLDLVKAVGRDGEGELMILPVGPHYPSPCDCALIESWAEPLGWSRVFSDEHVTALSGLVSIGDATATCGRCGTEHTDSSYEYWLEAAGAGIHAQFCKACGADGLPQRVVREKPVFQLSMKATPFVSLERLCAKDLEPGEDIIDWASFEDRGKTGNENG